MKKLIIVAAFLLAGCDDVFEHDISASAVEVLSPRDGVVVPEGKTSFAWRPVYGATAYRLSVVSPSFEKAAILVADTLLTVDSLHTGLRCDIIMASGDYQWSIRAKNTAYEGVETIHSLTVQPLNP